MTTEIMAIRATANDVQVQFWTDGAVTMGNPRVAMPLVARGLARRLAWIVADDVGLYEAGEIKALIKAARAAFDGYAYSRVGQMCGVRDHEIRRLMRVRFAVAAHKAQQKHRDFRGSEKKIE